MRRSPSWWPMPSRLKSMLLPVMECPWFSWIPKLKPTWPRGEVGLSTGQTMYLVHRPGRPLHICRLDP
ncbi:hypothetical protein ACFPRL_20215 [Pseudoclavibacter helvolus]